MKLVERKLLGVYEVILETYQDERGFFMRTYDKEVFEKHNLHREWVHDNHSCSNKKGIIRGLHFQFPPHCETKLIRCVRGAVFDVFVDLRRNSPTFGQWDSIELSEDNKKMIYIPRGFAHGFCTLADISELVYKVDNYYRPDAEGGIIWNDKTLNINWTVKTPVLSKRDANLGTFDEFVAKHRGLDI